MIIMRILVGEALKDAEMNHGTDGMICIAKTASDQYRLFIDGGALPEAYTVRGEEDAHYSVLSEAIQHATEIAEELLAEEGHS